ncbi:hypothetical protein BC829DRAFT_218866 [Chytridium lagenaria]|nr:hypothetical protein BC829DRAFT_218866 [Chytridium lagenaria]
MRGETHLYCCMASLQGNKASQYGSLYHRSATAPEVSTSRGQRCKARRRSLKDEKVQKETHDGLSERTISVLLAKLHSFEVKEEQDARPSPLRRRDSATGGVGGRRAQIQTQETYGKQVGLLLTNKNGSEEDVREYLEHEANDVFSKGDLPLRPHTMSGPRPFPAPVLMVTVKDLKAAAEERKIKEAR